MWNKCKVILLPTSSKPEIGQICQNNIQTFIYSKEHVKYHALDLLVEYKSTKFFYIYLLSSDDIKDNDWYINLNDEYITPNIFSHLTEKKQGMYKIIASDDPVLLLPKPSLDFKKIYSHSLNMNKKINDVMVKYNDVRIVESSESYDDDVLVVNGQEVMAFDKDQPEILHKKSLSYQGVFVDRNNTITITKLKNNFTYDDVREIIRETAIYFKAVGGNERDNSWTTKHIQLLEDFVEQKLK